MFPRQYFLANFDLLVVHGQTDSGKHGNRLEDTKNNKMPSPTADMKLKFFSQSSKAVIEGTTCCPLLAVLKSAERGHNPRHFLLLLVSPGRRCSQRPPGDESLIRYRRRGYTYKITSSVHPVRLTRIFKHVFNEVLCPKVVEFSATGQHEKEIVLGVPQRIGVDSEKRMDKTDFLALKHLTYNKHSSFLVVLDINNTASATNYNPPNFPNQSYTQNTSIVYAEWS